MKSLITAILLASVGIVSAQSYDATLAFSWSHEGYEDIATYRLYQSTTETDEYQRINTWNKDQITPVEAVSDRYRASTGMAVEEGQTYQFILTAVNANGIESLPSDPASWSPSRPGPPASVNLDVSVKVELNSR